MPIEPPEASNKQPPTNPTHSHDNVATPNLGNKRRSSTATGSRGVTSLTPEQLTKKRANDREAQRAIRERTKNQIETLERRVQELTSQQPYQELQAVIRQREAIQAENDEIRRRLSSALAVLEPILSSQGAHGEDYFSSARPRLANMFDIDQQTGPVSIAQHNAQVSQFGPDLIPCSTIHRFGHNQASAASVSPAISSITVPSTPQSVITPADQTWIAPAAAVPNSLSPWSPVNAFHQQRDALAHGLELGASGEKLGFGFLVDKGQNIARLSNGSSVRAASADGSIISSDCHPPSSSRMRTATAPDLGSYHGYGSPDGAPIAHSASVRNIAPTCPLDGLLLEFLAERRQQAAEGVPSQKLVGPAYPSVSSLLNPERSVYSHPLSKVFTDILRTFPDLSKLPEQVAVLYIMFLIMRWQISPTLENYNRLPDWVTPRPSQLFTPHPAWIDHLPWPHMRDKMVHTYQNYPFENFFIPFTTTLSLNWPYEDTDTLLSIPESDEFMINPVFERHLRNLHNWSLGPAFARAFPALVETTKIKADNQRLAA